LEWTDFSIVTPEANELTEPIHNRMPVILHPRGYERWLTDYDESRPRLDLLRPYESEGMRMTPATDCQQLRDNRAGLARLCIK
jgi:putative SOS response-associated peptidase YedK